MPRAKIVVNLPAGRSYDVRIGPGLLDEVGGQLAQALPGCSHVALVSDSNVAPLYGAAAKASLKQAGVRVVDITVPAGEQSKSLAVIGELWQALAAHKLDRTGAVVALGGGVVGDLAGFAAAAYLRGIAYVQLPTTLLAMVDSSVGGKTGIDLPAGKNLVGAFKQPAFVLADTDALDTLPAREWACGLGEVAKSGVIASDDFFFWLQDNADALASHDRDAVREAIARCVVFKAGVVARDEEERAGVRECLNYGHTLGHAIEVLAGYGTYSHGAAVAEGMRFASRLAASAGLASVEFVQAQDALLDALGLARLDFAAEADVVLDAMRNDKKSRDGQVRFVLPHDVGSWSVEAVDEGLLREHLDAWARSQ